MELTSRDLMASYLNPDGTSDLYMWHEGKEYVIRSVYTPVDADEYYFWWWQCDCRSA